MQIGGLVISYGESLHACWLLNASTWKWLACLSVQPWRRCVHHWKQRCHLDMMKSCSVWPQWLAITTQEEMNLSQCCSTAAFNPQWVSDYWYGLRIWEWTHLEMHSALFRLALLVLLILLCGLCYWVMLLLPLILLDLHGTGNYHWCVVRHMFAQHQQTADHILFGALTRAMHWDMPCIKCKKHIHAIHAISVKFILSSFSPF